ncbi:MAG: Holliday junction branch migration DNA helicase RuvB [Dehalococcoidales bacterium]|nr:MAG: Holliday junction branch migration DNA helicase RuvB [Dehalococcoidales bacterium]
MARITSGKPNAEDRPIETSLRPRCFDDFPGQNTVKDNLNIAIAAAKGRGEALDHILFYGPPGLGKTCLSHIIATEMGSNIRVTSGPAIERTGDLAAILTNLHKQDILFIDEIHRLNRAVEEILYPAMEDSALDIIIGKGPGAKSLRLNLPTFTLIGATTRFAMLSPPLRDRFGAVYHLDFYDQATIETILKRSSEILQIEANTEGLQEIARRARGTPRVANRLLKRVRDYAQVKADGRVTEAVAVEALARLEVDPIGLDELDRKVLSTIIDKFNGGPVGLETIAASISEESDAIMDIYEPYLLQLGFLERTPRGRVATPLAYEHLGRPNNRDKSAQQTMW